MATETNPLDACQLINVRKLSRLLGISERTCWRLSALAEAGQGNFPKPVRLSARSVRWRLADVRRYVETLAKAEGDEHSGNGLGSGAATGSARWRQARG